MLEIQNLELCISPDDILLFTKNLPVCKVKEVSIAQVRDKKTYVLVIKGEVDLGFILLHHLGFCVILNKLSVKDNLLSAQLVPRKPIITKWDCVKDYILGAIRDKSKKFGFIYVQEDIIYVSIKELAKYFNIGEITLKDIKVEKNKIRLEITNTTIDLSKLLKLKK